MRRILLLAAAAALFPARRTAAQGVAPAASAGTATGVLGDAVDVALDFQGPDQSYFVASRVTRFDPATGRGTLQWDRYARRGSMNFQKVDLALTRAPATEFPGTEYDRDPALPFAIDFVSPRTLRLRFSTRDVPVETMSPSTSLMLAGPVPSDR